MKKKIRRFFGIMLILTAMATAVFFGWTTIIRPHYGNKVISEKTSSNIAYYHCGMHTWIKSDKPGNCPVCGMPLTPVYKSQATGEKGLVHIDPVMVQDIGVKTESVMRRTLKHTIRTSGIVDYDETKQSDITIKFSGYIEKLYADYTGKPIEKGQPLFTIYSPELIAAQQEFLQAVKYKATMGSDGSAKTSTNELTQSAKQKLLLWDISENQINLLQHTGKISKTLTIYSPYSGVVIEKDVVEGMAVPAGMTLLKLADISKMWVYADVYPNELSWVKQGAKVEMQLPYNPGKTLTGSVSYIYPFLQDQTRTAKVRIEFLNPGDMMKKDMYVQLNIKPTASVQALAIPEQAVIHSGERDVVVLALRNGEFKPVNVKLGSLDDGYYEVLQGLKEGDVIVTSSQFLIDSESNLQAGTANMQSMPGMDMATEGKEQNNTHATMQNTKTK